MFNLDVAHDTYLVYLIMETIIEGNVSIVLGIDTDTITEKSNRFSEILDAYANNSGIKEFKDSKGLVRVHCESRNLGISDLSNWAKFGIDAFVDSNTITMGEMLALRDNYRFPSYLPIELFLGKKEGEIVMFASKWGEVHLRLCQDKWQTGNIPPFHRVLNKLFQI